MVALSDGLINLPQLPNRMEVIPKHFAANRKLAASFISCRNRMA